MTGHETAKNYSELERLYPLRRRMRSFARDMVVFLLSALGFLLAFYAHAEQVEPLQFIAAPETPGPREQVMIEAQGIGNFLGNADIIWSVDGKAVKRGMGERTFIFTTGALGERTSVRVTIDSETQGFFSRTFTFTPSLVNLVWEADTTVPPLYRGKALYSAGSPLKVVAFPTVYSGSSRVAPSALSYQWERGGESVPEASGLGRYGFSFSGDQLKNAETVGVDVYYGNTKAARGEITISAAEPQVLFYERDPLRGILYEKALPAAISLAGTVVLKACSIMPKTYDVGSSFSILYGLGKGKCETCGRKGAKPSRWTALEEVMLKLPKVRP